MIHAEKHAAQRGAFNVPVPIGIDPDVRSVGLHAEFATMPGLAEDPVPDLLPVRGVQAALGPADRAHRRLPPRRNAG